MLKIILADNQAIFRTGAAKVLAVEDDIRIVAHVQDADQLINALEKFRPAVLIYSASLQPDPTPVVAAAERLKTRVVAVAENGDNPSRYLNAGVSGVVYRSVGGPPLVDCVRKVAKGQNFVQDTEAAKEAAENDLVGARVRDRLTQKELKIIALIVQGFKNKEIAQQLGTTEQVIKNYLRNVYDKIGVSDRLELALFTIHHQILAEAAAATTGASAAASGAN